MSIYDTIEGARACELFNRDPHWRDLIPFHEYFHGDTGRGCGASHQTGWTGLIAEILINSDENTSKGDETFVPKSFNSSLRKDARHIPQQGDSPLTEPSRGDY